MPSPPLPPAVNFTYYERELGLLLSCDPGNRYRCSAAFDAAAISCMSVEHPAFVQAWEAEKQTAMAEDYAAYLALPKYKIGPCCTQGYILGCRAESVGNDVCDLACNNHVRAASLARQRVFSTLPLALPEPEPYLSSQYHQPLGTHTLCCYGTAMGIFECV